MHDHRGSGTSAARGIQVLCDEATPSFGIGNGLRAGDKMRALSDLYDVAHLVAERPIDGPPPAPFLRGYMDDSVLRQIAHKMRRQALGEIDIPERRTIITISQQQPAAARL